MRERWMTKLHDGEAHAAFRLKERYGLTFTLGLKAEITREIKRASREIRERTQHKRKPRRARERGREVAAFLITGYQRPRTQHWLVSTSQGRLWLVYDAVDHLVVTFLPPRDTGGLS